MHQHTVRDEKLHEHMWYSMGAIFSKSPILDLKAYSDPHSTLAKSFLCSDVIDALDNERSITGPDGTVYELRYSIECWGDAMIQRIREASSRGWYVALIQEPEHKVNDKGIRPWGLITGKVEYDETAYQCIIRECFEEAGLKVFKWNCIQSLPCNKWPNGTGYHFMAFADDIVQPSSSNEIMDDAVTAEPCPPKSIAQAARDSLSSARKFIWSLLCF